MLDLNDVVLVQAGESVAAPTGDNVQAHPAIGSAAPDPQAALKELNARFPNCTFTWFSNPLPRPTPAKAPAARESEPAGAEGSADKARKGRK